VVLSRHPVVAHGSLAQSNGVRKSQDEDGMCDDVGDGMQEVVPCRTVILKQH